MRGNNMMKWVSFQYMLEPLLAGIKTVTRREWRLRHTRRFHEGDFVQAFDKMPSTGGKRVAMIQLTCDPYLENTANMPNEDWINEGLAFMEENGQTIKGIHPAAFWLKWKEHDKIDLFVIRFKVAGF